MSASDSSRKGPAGPAAPRTSTKKEKAPLPPRSRPKSFGPPGSSGKKRGPGSGSGRRHGAGGARGGHGVPVRRTSLVTSPRPTVSEAELRADFQEFLAQPEIAVQQFSLEVQEHLFQYGQFLALRSAQLNLISQEDRPRLFTRHVFECLIPGLVSHARGSQSLVDIGSGGGLPGIPLAIVAPEAPQSLLVEPRQRKAQFLEAAIASLGLSPRVELFQGTAEKLMIQSASEIECRPCDSTCRGSTVANLAVVPGIVGTRGMAGNLQGAPRNRGGTGVARRLTPFGV